MTVPTLAQPRAAEVGRQLHTGPVVPRLFRLADDSGQVWECAEIDRLRQWIHTVNIKGSEGQGQEFPEPIMIG